MTDALYIDAVILFSLDLEKAVRFYRALGVPLETEDHGDGVLHYACELGPAHFAIYAGPPGGDVPALRAAGSSITSFRIIGSIDTAIEAARAHGGELVSGPEDRPWGRRALVLDPDGRVMELNQAR